MSDRRKKGDLMTCTAKGCTVLFPIARADQRFCSQVCRDRNRNDAALQALPRYKRGRRPYAALDPLPDRPGDTSMLRKRAVYLDECARSNDTPMTSSQWRVVQ